MDDFFQTKKVCKPKNLEDQSSLEELSNTDKIDLCNEENKIDLLQKFLNKHKK